MYIEKYIGGTFNKKDYLSTNIITKKTGNEEDTSFKNNALCKRFKRRRKI